MTSVLVLNGPNLNLLGTRKPEVYGRTTLADVEAMCREEGGKLGLDVEFRQSNHEGALIDRLEQRDYDGIVINPGALTHYSYALHDALVASEKPGIEIHVSDIHQREPWRRVSVTRPAVTDTVIGKGWQGYLEAVDRLIDIVEGQT